MQVLIKTIVVILIFLSSSGTTVFCLRGIRSRSSRRAAAANIDNSHEHGTKRGNAVNIVGNTIIGSTSRAVVTPNINDNNNDTLPTTVIFVDKIITVPSADTISFINATTESSSSSVITTATATAAAVVVTKMTTQQQQGPQLSPTPPARRLIRLTDEQRLMNKLFRYYDRHSRPVFNNNDPVVISMSLTIRQIFELDEKNQVLIIDAWVNFEWVDEYLSWDPRNYSNLEVVRIVSWKMWLPDIVLYNNAADFSPNEGFNSRAMVASNGAVFWSVPSKLSSSCKIDVTYFPFDEQVCRMKFGSWTHDGFKIDLINSSTSADLAFYVPNGEWDLVSAEQRRNVVVYTCCAEPYPDVTFFIHIRRRGFYYVLNVFLPCFLMSGLTILVFLLPVESGEKCGLGITIMLSFAVFMLSVIEKLPDTSESFPLISIYLAAVMSTTAVTVFISVLVLRLNYKSSRSGPVPMWLRRLLNKLAPMCCVHDKPIMPKSIQTLDMHINDFLKCFGKSVAASDDLDMFLVKAMCSPNNRQSRLDKTYHQIVLGVNRILDRAQKDEETDKHNNDWRRLAQFFDRCLFYILLLVFIIYTVFLLIVVPTEKIL